MLDPSELSNLACTCMVATLHAMVSTEWPVCLHLPYKGMMHVSSKQISTDTVDLTWWGLPQL